MKDYVRMFSSGDGEHLLVNVQPFDVIVAFEILDVVARSTCYIEQESPEPVLYLRIMRWIFSASFL